ncbi:hypothetical protein AOB46_17090 [Chryseobacterium indologenes]|uniref:Uncharacterized protein n=1 Tax=Chryseobacterium indologenes TaxID=253 RepID=A0A0N0ZSZ1_CHRID|nr:hypothetical protein AOB46_17090 [Chryseobacterium indologenes]
MRKTCGRAIFQIFKNVKKKVNQSGLSSGKSGYGKSKSVSGGFISLPEEHLYNFHSKTKG